MLIEGTDSDVGYRVGQHMEHLLQARGLRLEVKPLFPDAAPETMEACFAALRSVLAEDSRCVAVIGLDEPWNHWTVATKATRRGLKMFDSYHRRRLKRLTLEDLSLTEAPGKIVFDAPAAVIYRRCASPLSRLLAAGLF